MKDIFFTPLLAGLSAGVYCIVYCMPFVAPLMVLKPRLKKDDFSIVLKFIFGRFLGYIAFGAFAGFLGSKINNETINSIIIVSLIILSIVTILNSSGVLNAKRFSFCAKIKHPELPILMGFLMGINICPPFLMSLTYVFSLHDFAGGIVYFLIFFAGTSIYFLPLFFLGSLGKTKEFQMAGKISGIVVGIVFLLYSIYKLINGV